jgi:leader peptidase (prepilin peptidase)/N-methyltransferase
LRWYENIPIISYLIQGGKSRCCHKKLNISYLVMELCTGVVFSVCYHVYDFSLDLIVALIFVSSMITIIISDIEYMIILDEVLIFASVGIIVIDLFNIGVIDTAMRILSGIGAFLTMLFIKYTGDKMFKQDSLGGGDIKMMFVVGLVLGYSLSVCNIFLATFIAFPIALILLITKKNNVIPFGPFLGMAALIIFISGVTFTEIITYIVS